MHMLHEIDASHNEAIIVDLFFLFILIALNKIDLVCYPVLNLIQIIHSVHKLTIWVARQ